MSENKNFSKSQLLQNFDHSIFRFAYLHSWYKLRPRPGLIINCTVIPVTGNVQEYKKYGCFDPEEPINIFPNQVFWHFCDTEWCSPLHPKLQKLISENQIQIQSMSEIYCELFDVPIGQTKEDYYADYKHVIDFQNEKMPHKSWKNFQPIYDKFKSAAEIITENLIQHPDIPIPHIIFAPSFMPHKDSDDETEITKNTQKPHILSATPEF
jgi:hypothetical protein